MSKIKKGYKVGPAINDSVKCAVISIVIIAFMWRLAQYKGIPMILIWVAVIVLIYTTWSKAMSDRLPSRQRKLWKVP